MTAVVGGQVGTYVYQNGSTQLLPGLAGTATDMNAFGVATGEFSPNIMSRAFSYENGVQQNLGTLGGSVSSGTGISDTGYITGNSTYNGFEYPHAFRAFNGQLTDLGTLGGTTSYGKAVNDAGQTAGYSFNSHSIYRAFLYENGVMKDLGAFGDETLNSFAYDINSAGTVVGIVAGGGRDHGFVYENGALFDLGNLVDGSGAGWTIMGAYKINDQGIISASVMNASGQYQSALLSPVPEPGTLLVLGLGASVFLRRRRR